MVDRNKDDPLRSTDVLRIVAICERKTLQKKQLFFLNFYTCQLFRYVLEENYFLSVDSKIFQMILKYAILIIISNTVSGLLIWQQIFKSYNW